MKILKRNYEHRNLILFLIFSMVYLQAIYSLSRGESLFELSVLKTFWKNHYMLLALNLLTIYGVVKVKRHSDKILMIFLAAVTGKNFIMLAASFNKLILGLNFIYLIFAFYFFVTWELELAKASYNPEFSANDLEKDTRFPLKGRVESEDGNSFNVHITNIDENSCFAIVEKEARDQMGSLNSGSVYTLSAEYEGVKFTHKATLASLYDCGIGLDFMKEQAAKSQLNWSDLHKVCLERGLFE